MSAAENSNLVSVNVMYRTLIFVLLFFLLVPIAKAKNQKLSYSKNFENFTEAHKAYEGELVPLSEGLSFMVTSTKIGLFSSQVSGLVKNYKAQGLLTQESVEGMEVIFPILSMDTDQESRDKKLHELCLGSPQFMDIKIMIQGPVKISPTEANEEEVMGVIFIRGKEKNIKLKIKIFKSTLNNEAWLRSEGQTILSLKELEIPDPSILVAKVSDEIQVKFKINIPLK